MLKKYFVNPFTVFFSAAVVFFWPLSFFLFSVKNDALTYYYPVRTLISDALHNGELPLWTPYINMGYPLHADMQSAAWNPVIWVWSLVSNYSLGAFHYELIFYLCFAGIGFYHLCRNMGCSKNTAYTIGFAYMFSGFMVDSVQFFNCISAACYLPWIIVSFRKMMTDQERTSAAGMAFFLFLLFTGGYPSLFIITVYVLAAYFLFFVFSTLNKINFLKRTIPQLLLASILFLLLSLPAIISFIQHLPMINRGKSQPLSFILENSMNPATCLSLLMPFATTAQDQWLSSQIIMRNMYVGIIPLLFFMYAFTEINLRKNKELIFFAIMTLLLIGMAFGKFFFLREIAYQFLPLMDSFRHPALFRLFSIFFLLLISAAALKEWELKKIGDCSFFRKAIIALLLLAITSSITLFILKYSAGILNFIDLKNIKNLFPLLDFKQRFLIETPLLILILLLSWFAIVKKKNIRLIFIFTILDLFFATQLNLPVTVIGAKQFTEVEQLINRNLEKFPVPDNSSIEINSANSSGENFITGSSLPFTKKIGRNDYYISPGNLSTQDQFYESAARGSVFKKTVLYFQPGVGPDSSQQISIQSISANSLTATIGPGRGGTLVYLQNKYPGWKAFVDGDETAILPVHQTFMSIQVTPGPHKVYFKYQPIAVVIAWCISTTTLVILLLWFTIIFFQKRNKRNPERKT